LEQNDLKTVEAVMESTAILIANKKSLRDLAKQEKIYDIITLLRGVVDGRKKLHIFVNVNKKNLDKLLTSLPALKRPTVSPLSDKDWFSVNTVIERDRFLEILPTLRKLAQGLVVYEPRQVLPLDEMNFGGNSES
jgi:ATP phosphoribosyltransferase